MATIDPSLAHDLRGWLAIVLGQCELPFPKIERIHQAAVRMRDLLLPTAPAIDAQIHLQKMIADVLEPLTPAPASFVLELRLEPIYLPAKFLALDRVVQNILWNALAAIKRIGRLDGQIVIRCHSQSNSVILGITDNGGGMPKELIEQFQNRALLPGKGLSVIRELLAAMGVFASLESDLSGTRYAMWLPVQK